MNIKSLNIVTVAISTLLLIGCQTTTSAPPSDIPQINNIVTLIPDIPDSDGDGVLDDIDACPMTPVNTAVDKNGCPIPIDLIGFLTLEIRVFYENNSDELREKYLPEVEKLAEKLNKYPNQVVVLSGHTSKREVTDTLNGSNRAMEQTPEDNAQLGRMRAHSVKQALIERGVPDYRIYTFDCANEMPIASDDTYEGTQLDQRVYVQAVPAIDFLKGKGSGSAESYDYYKSSCQQF
ncbi:OmpA family protein [uncultured Psychrobacter sp.]|uniref:OmpA family protein n=1 Tax=uncultured Psychrobacter sp. TaxID=259303 RepID=UPI002603297C|nr:OmpA family protein [uncultured Psychrobacter sp.]